MTIKMMLKSTMLILRQIHVCGAEAGMLDGAMKNIQSVIDKLEELCESVKSSALCGLGQTAPNPILSTLKFFREEYVEHVRDKKCRAGVCKALLSYKIDPEKCKGCSLCARNCPVDAISGQIKNPYTIDTTKCVKCGLCESSCKFGAISK